MVDSPSKPIPQSRGLVVEVQCTAMSNVRTISDSMELSYGRISERRTASLAMLAGFATLLSLAAFVVDVCGGLRWREIGECGWYAMMAVSPVLCFIVLKRTRSSSPVAQNCEGMRGDSDPSTRCIGNDHCGLLEQPNGGGVQGNSQLLTRDARHCLGTGNVCECQWRTISRHSW